MHQNGRTAGPAIAWEGLHRPFLTILCGISLLSTTANFAQAEQPLGSVRSNMWDDKGTVFSYTMALRDSVLPLPVFFQLHTGKQSLSVYLDSLLLVEGSEFTIDTGTSTLHLRPELYRRIISPIDSLHAVASSHFLRLELRTVQPFIKTHFVQSARGGLVFTDSMRRDSAMFFSSEPFRINEIFGSNLSRSGSLSRGISVGSNQDLSVTSNFRLQLSGKLTDDISIRAALTDQNSPIPPEGTTRTLQEFDKVFVEINSPRVAATLGDFDLLRTNGEFAKVQRRLQGAEMRISLGGVLRNASDGILQNMSASLQESGTGIDISAAVARGKFTTNQFNGLDAVQGPYQLTGANGERGIVVVPGSERVYINGELMLRGATDDYTIDYSLAQITFTVKRPITAASRISVDFQYVDRKFTRTFAGVEAISDVAGFHFGLSYYREADNPDSPVDVSLSDSDRAVIAAAGNNPLAASKSSIQYVGVDSLTGIPKGRYKLVDTLINGTVRRILRYSPGDPGALYNATFSYVGNGRGDYARQQIGEYVYVGPSAGSYLPIVLLPLPEMHQLADISFAWDGGSLLHAEGEYAFSSFDPNRLSAIANEQNSGHAFRVGVSLKPARIQIGSTVLGEIGASISDRYYGATFRPLDRVQAVEFNRIWDITDTLPGSKNVALGEIIYQPLKVVRILNSFGFLTLGSGLTSSKLSASLLIGTDTARIVDYKIDYVRRRGDMALRSSSWWRQYATAQLDAGFIKPSFHFEMEDRREYGTDTLTRKNVLSSTSFRFYEIGPQVVIPILSRSLLHLSGFFRVDEIPDGDRFARQSTSVGYGASWRFANSIGVSSSLDLTKRSRRFSGLARSSSGDVNTLLIRSVSQYHDKKNILASDLYYEFSAERAAKLERVFLRVERGSGNYAYLGDLNHNGVADDNEFVPVRFDGEYVPVTVPSDRLYPVSSVKSSLRVRFAPSRSFGAPRSSDRFIQKVLRSISSETYIRVEEKSMDPHLSNLYLLRLSTFLNDSTTLTGMDLFSQDVYLLENNSFFSARGRFLIRRSMSQFASFIERSGLREHSLRFLLKPLEEFSLQLEYLHRVNRLNSTPSTSLGTGTTSGRTYDVSGDAGLFDFSYRPQQDIEFGLHIEVGENRNQSTAPVQIADINVEGIRFVRSIAGRGQFRAELNREEVNLSPSAAGLFELTNGRLPGVHYLWAIGGDLRFAGFMEATFRYDGRTDQSNRVINSVRMEVRAFF
ncbi:MAG: hypothetical protein ACP5ON_04285 [Bacteroidota bacterium]